MTTQDNGKKFLLLKLPADSYLAQAMVKTVRVGYLYVDDISEVKILHVFETNEYFLVKKVSSVDGARSKEKEPISKEVHDMLSSLVKNKWVEKKTYTIQDSEYILRIDSFLRDTTQGRPILLEVTTVPDSSVSLKDFVHPDAIWTTGQIDPADEAKYLNQNLAN